MEKFELKSFNDTWKELKSDEANKNLIHAKKEAELSSCMKSSYVNYLDAQSDVKKAIIDDNSDIASVVKNFEATERTYNFYKKLYESLFPNV